MTLQDTSEATQVWVLWQMLQQLSDLLWNRYDQDFANFNLDEDLSPVD